MTRIALALALPGEAEGLTGIAGSEDMNAATPWAAIEGFKVTPDRCLIQGRVRHPCHESGRSMGFALDVTHSAISGLGDGETKVETAVTGAEGKAGEIASAGGT